MLLVHSNEAAKLNIYMLNRLWICVEVTPPNLKPNAAAGFC